MNGVYRGQLTWEFNGYPLRANSDTGLEKWRENGDQWRIGRTNDYYYVCNEENPLQVWTSPGKTWPRWGNVRPFKVIIILQ